MIKELKPQKKSKKVLEFKQKTSDYEHLNQLLSKLLTYENLDDLAKLAY